VGYERWGRGRGDGRHDLEGSPDQRLLDRHRAGDGALMIEAGTPIHVVERRLFDGDLRRHFVGEVLTVGPNAVTAGGYAFVYDVNRDCWERLPDRRARVVSLVDSRLLIRLLPADVDVEQVHYTSENKRHVVTDGRSFSIDVNEFSPVR
jgi:hypothetical protein